MATDNQSMVAGMFMTPEMYQQQQFQNILANRTAQANMTPEQQAQFSLNVGLDRAAQGLGGLMGVEDPQMKALAAIQQLGNQFDLSTSAGNMQMVKALQDRGLAGPAAQFAAKAAALRKEEASSMPEKQRLAVSLADSKAQRNTPEWTQAYQEALGEVINPEKLTATQKEYAQALKDGSFKGSFNQWLTEDANRKRPVTNVNVSTGENAYGTEFGKGIAAQDLAKYSLAQKASDILANADSTEKLLQSGKVFTGTGASAKLNLLALGQGMGVTGKNADEIIANTQQLQQQRAQAVLSQVKSSGLGTGQGFTDKDLKFLQDAAAGSITLSKETLQRQLNIERKIARAAAKDWNSRLGTMPQKVIGSMGLSSIELPPQTSFDNVDEANAAKLPKGTVITVGGRRAVVE